MSPLLKLARCLVTTVAALTLVTSACSQSPEGSASAAKPPTTGSDSERPSDPEPTDVPDDPAAFCAAAEALDQTDGTTAEAVVLDAIDELRRTAPGTIREDVILVSDNLIINNFPSSADPSMQKASIEEIQGAGNRVGSFVDEHCDLNL